MNFELAQLVDWVHDFTWPFVRIGAMLLAAPLFAARFIPRRVRVLLGFTLAIALLPILPPMPVVEPFSSAGMLILIQQVIIGIAMGTILQMVFDAVVIGGQTIAMSMGLGFAFMVDPQRGVSVPVLSQMYLILATLLFLALNGHLLIISLLAESFTVLPVGEPLAPGGLWTVVAFASRMFAGAMLIALPAVVAILVVNMSFGVMSRAAPTLNLFAVGFPVTMLFGFIIVMLTIPALGPVFNALIADATDAVGIALSGGR